MLIIIGIGNGLHADGTPSAMSAAIVNACRQFARNPAIHPGCIVPAQEGIKIIFSGGYSVNNITEAESMYNLYKTDDAPAPALIEARSYRTHNNAVEGLRAVQQTLTGRIGPTVVVVVDHPLHIERTRLAFVTANRLYFHGRYKIIGVESKGDYDSRVPGQAYWATEELFAAHERKSMLLYRFLLWELWARIGFWLLRTVWPSSKQ